MIPAVRAQRGFTLIELLVVVAIIGMLSSIVLTSVATARDKANNATIKRNLATVRQQAALYASNGGTFGATFTAASCPSSGTSMFYVDTVIRNAITAAQVAGGGATRCGTDGVDYAVSVQYRASTTHWCLDSRGSARDITNASWTGALCP
jgi:prepilin-type N-terminal cleavage/methylation domain-containing protein